MLKLVLVLSIAQEGQSGGFVEWSAFLLSVLYLKGVTILRCCFSWKVNIFVTLSNLSDIMNFCFFTGYKQQTAEKALQLNFEYKSNFDQFLTNFEQMAMVGMDAMQRANSTLEDFVSSFCCSWRKDFFLGLYCIVYLNIPYDKLRIWMEVS